jgi:hypothetical protein
MLLLDSLKTSACNSGLAGTTSSSSLITNIALPNGAFITNTYDRKEQDLPGLSKGNKDKVALARRLLQETTMSLKWMARRLHMGSWTYVSNLLHEKRRR